MYLYVNNNNVIWQTTERISNYYINHINVYWKKEIIFCQMFVIHCIQIGIEMGKQ